MLVGLMSDSHDRVPAIRALLERMIERGAGMVLHAGDYCSPFSLSPFLELNVPFAGVFGRNDGDREGLKAFAAKGVGIELHESPHSFEVGGRRILIVHDLAEVLDLRDIEIALKLAIAGDQPPVVWQLQDEVTPALPRPPARKAASANVGTEQPRKRGESVVPVVVAGHRININVWPFAGPVVAKGRRVRCH